jgi:hypothetical protein
MSTPLSSTLLLTLEGRTSRWAQDGSFLSTTWAAWSGNGRTASGLLPI